MRVNQCSKDDDETLSANYFLTKPNDILHIRFQRKGEPRWHGQM